MSELSRRIDRLSPEQRKLLERLLAAQGLSSSAAVREADQAGLDRSPGKIDRLQASFDSRDEEEERPAELSGDPSSRSKARTRRFYNSVSRQLDGSPFGEYAFFLNYGYVPDDQPRQALFPVPEHQINRNSIRLVLEVIGTCPLAGRAVLDVGCGRGGTLHVIHVYFTARRLVGLDLSSAAIMFCRRRHNYPDTQFLQGDAELLPFAAEAFDVVINIESSHTYPNACSFFQGVYRVLRPGGYFLYADVLHNAVMDRHLAELSSLGFIGERNQDITRNVLLSCDATARRHAQAFSEENDAGVMREFLSTPDSQVYQDMAARRAAYKIFHLRKP